MGNTSSKAAGVILLVEDSRMDEVLARKCFEEVAPGIQLHHVQNGLEALAFLRREDKYNGAPAPDLVLLDLNMPMMDGRQTLAEIVGDEDLQHIPVVVLTNSQFEEDVRDAYKMRASSYIRKPVDFNDFIRIVRGLVAYWFDLVVLPEDTEST
jgi:two-component system response regulator